MRKIGIIVEKKRMKGVELGGSEGTLYDLIQTDGFNRVASGFRWLFVKISICIRSQKFA